jgi:hypothetical protein
MNDHITKPIDPDVVFAAIEALNALNIKLEDSGE